jgi:hypothetical protein
MKHVQRVRKNGRRFYYYRRPGHPRYRLPGEPGSIEFLAAYQAAMEQGPSLKISASRNKPGTIRAQVKKLERPGEGHRTWTVAEVEQFRAFYPIGTKARLALEW